jgi:2-(3-amino-3-carboxypropyl)histidine synthase
MQEVIKRLKALGSRRIFIQFPEGLKLKIQEIAETLEKEGFECIICLEKTFGACDIRNEEAKRLGCDAILHIGHTDFGIKTDIPVIYWEYFLDADPIPTLEKEFRKLEKYERIGLVTNVQFAKVLEKVKAYLEKRGKKVLVSENLSYPGQILGCKLEAATALEADVDCFLCVSAGKFYALGLALKTEKPVLSLDLEKGFIEDLEKMKNKIRKLEAWNKSQLENAKRVGILISWKLGQLKLPLELKVELEKVGKIVYLLAMDEISPQKLEGLKLDVLINCACPRIGTDDLEIYKIPLINVNNL